MNLVYKPQSISLADLRPGALFTQSSNDFAINPDHLRTVRDYINAHQTTQVLELMDLAVYSWLILSFKTQFFKLAESWYAYVRALQIPLSAYLESTRDSEKQRLCIHLIGQKGRLGQFFENSKHPRSVIGRQKKPLDYNNLFPQHNFF